jgi:hypothetical protein
MALGGKEVQQALQCPNVSLVLEYWVLELEPEVEIGLVSRCLPSGHRNPTAIVLGSMTNTPNLEIRMWSICVVSVIQLNRDVIHQVIVGSAERQKEV